MVKDEWLAAGALLMPSSAGLVNQWSKYAGVEIAHSFSQWESKTSCTDQ
jgi:hypothetical protein